MTELKDSGRIDYVVTVVSLKVVFVVNFFFFGLRRLVSHTCIYRIEKCQLHSLNKSYPQQYFTDVRYFFCGSNIYLICLFFVFVIDVVYDPSIIPALTRVIHRLLLGGVSDVYIASTLRNQDTNDAFLRALGNKFHFF